MRFSLICAWTKVEKTIETPVIWDIIALIVTSLTVMRSPACDTLWCQWTLSILVQVMAWYGACSVKPLPETMVNYCQLDFKNQTVQWNLNRNISIEENAFQIAICKMLAILTKAPSVKAIWLCWNGSALSLVWGFDILEYLLLNDTWELCLIFEIFCQILVHRTGET